MRGNTQAQEDGMCWIANCKFLSYISLPVKAQVGLGRVGSVPPLAQEAAPGPSVLCLSLRVTEAVKRAVLYRFVQCCAVGYLGQVNNFQVSFPKAKYWTLKQTNQKQQQKPPNNTKKNPNKHSTTNKK